MFFISATDFAPTMRDVVKSFTIGHACNSIFIDIFVDFLKQQFKGSNRKIVPMFCTVSKELKPSFAHGKRFSTINRNRNMSINLVSDEVLIIIILLICMTIQTEGNKGHY